MGAWLTEMTEEAYIHRTESKKNYAADSMVPL